MIVIPHSSDVKLGHEIHTVTYAGYQSINSAIDARVTGMLSYQGSRESGYLIFVDDEGMLRELPLNELAQKMYRAISGIQQEIYGRVLLATVEESGEADFIPYVKPELRRAFEAFVSRAIGVTIKDGKIVTDEETIQT